MSSIIKRPTTKLGIVVNNSRYKEGTLKVRVDYVLKNNKYKKNIKRFTNFLVQYDLVDASGKNRAEIALNTRVLIVACRSISKKKNFFVKEVL